MSANRKFALWRVLAVLLAFSLFAAACGDDDDSAGSDSATTDSADSADGSAEQPTTEPAEEPDATTGGEPSEEPTEEPVDEPTAEPVPELPPVKIYMLLDENEAAGILFPDNRAGAQARIDRINAEGGLGGSGTPVELVFCVTSLDPNAAADCAREAVEDPAVIAVAGSVNITADTIVPVTSEAGLPYVGMLPLQTSDFTNPLAYPLIGGLASAVPGQAVIAAQDFGATNIVNGRAGIEAAAQGTLLIDLALQSWGFEPSAAAVDVPIGQADVSAQVLAMAEDADAVVLSLAPGQDQQVMLARQALGIDVQFFATGSNFTQKDIDELGDAVEGLQLVSYYPPDGQESEGNSAFLADMEAVGALEQTGDLARQSWSAIDFIDHVAAGMDTFDRESLVAGINASNDYDAGGMLPTIDFTAPGANPLFPRIVNNTMLHTEISGGTVVVVGDGEFRPVFGG